VRQVNNPVAAANEIVHQASMRRKASSAYNRIRSRKANHAPGFRNAAKVRAACAVSVRQPAA